MEICIGCLGYQYYQCYLLGFPRSGLHFTIRLMVVGVCTGMVETIFLCKCLEFLRNELWAIIRIILLGCAISRDMPFYFVDDILGCCAVYPIELKKVQVIVHCYQVIFFFVLEKVCCKLGRWTVWNV